MKFKMLSLLLAMATTALAVPAPPTALAVVSISSAGTANFTWVPGGGSTARTVLQVNSVTRTVNSNAGVNQASITGFLPGVPTTVVGFTVDSLGVASTLTASVVVIAPVSPTAVTYVYPAPGAVFTVSGTGSGAASAVTVISSVLPTGASTSALQTAGNSTLSTISTNFSNVTVNTHAVTQGGPWLVSGSVSTLPSGAYQGVSVFAGVAGLTVTASQGSPWTVSGSVGITSGVAGLTVTASQGSPWTVSGSVGVISGVAGISVTASQGSPFTVSGSVSVTNLTGVTVNTHAVTQGGPWTVSGSVSTVPSGAFQGVSVFAGVAGLTVTASQGSPWTVSGSVGVTSLPSAFLGVSVVSQVDASSFKGVSIVSDTTTRFYGVTVTSGVAGLTVTASQGSPWTVSGSVGVISGVAGISVTASISGGVSVTNPASAAVQIAGSITNTVAISSTALTAINNKIPLATNTVRQRTVITAGTTETTILTSGGVGVFHDIDLIFVSNPDSNTDCTVSFRDATTGAIIFEGQAARAGGGFVLPFPVALPQAASNNNWTAEIDLAASPGIIINVVGHVRQ